jgi:enoyl-CoA hydratase/carnithine racemase
MRRDGSVAFITLRRPDAMSAISTELAEALGSSIGPW